MNAILTKEVKQVGRGLQELGCGKASDTFEGCAGRHFVGRAERGAHWRFGGIRFLVLVDRLLRRLFIVGRFVDALLPHLQLLLQFYQQKKSNFQSISVRLTSIFAVVVVVVVVGLYLSFHLLNAGP